MGIVTDSKVGGVVAVAGTAVGGGLVVAVAVAGMLVGGSVAVAETVAVVEIEVGRGVAVAGSVERLQPTNAVSNRISNNSRAMCLLIMMSPFL